MGWSDPLLGAFGCPKESCVRSSPSRSSRDLVMPASADGKCRSDFWCLAIMNNKALMSQTARLNRRPQWEGENVARRRFQQGSVRRRGNVWIERYLEDVVENGAIRRKRSEERRVG